MSGLAERIQWGLVPAVPVPFRGDRLDAEAQQEYARWMATQPIAGVAVWAHTGRGPHLSPDQRREVLDTWRGALPHDQRWKALAEIDVLVVSSIWYENSPLTIHEALVAGVPVIGSAMGGIPELVAHERTGLIYPALDADALAACLRRVTEDPACVARWRAAITRPKTMERHVDEIEGLYRELRSGARPEQPAPPTG